MVVFHVSTFILLLHIAGGSSFRTSRPQPAKAIRKEKRLKTAWLSRFPLAGAEGLGLSCRLGRCFCLLVCRGLHRRPAPLDTLRVPRFHFLHIQKTANTAKAVLAVLWEDYKKDFLAFLGWYLYPYKKS